MSQISRSQVKALVGKEIYAVRRDGSVVRGRLVRLNGDELIVEPTDGKARTKLFLPLVLFDLLAIGTLPYYNYGWGFDPFWW
jgi:hypothetical protein